MLEASVGVSQDVTKPGYWVYALVSPLWGKCYIGGTGYTRPRCLLERWIEHIRMAKLWMSNTSQHRFRSRQSQVYAAMCSIGIANVVMIKIASPQPKELFQAEAFYTRKLQPVLNSGFLLSIVLAIAKSSMQHTSTGVKKAPLMRVRQKCG